MDTVGQTWSKPHTKRDQMFVINDIIGHGERIIHHQRAQAKRHPQTDPGGEMLTVDSAAECQRIKGEHLDPCVELRTGFLVDFQIDGDDRMSVIQ